MPATPSIPRAPSSMATCRSASPPPRRTCCSSRSSSTGSTTPCSTPRWRDPALGHYRPWLEDIRKDKPYQLEDRIEQLFHEKSVTALFGLEPAVRRDHRGAALQGRRRNRWRSSRRSICCRTRARRPARRRPRRSPRPSRKTCGSFTLITNTLAKDKEISDRWRGFDDVADARHLANRVEPEVVDALVSAGARSLSAAVAPLLRAQGTLVRQEEARRTGTATRRCRR